MAFLSKAGSILRQSLAKNVNSQNIAAYSPSLLQSIRFMSSSKVFVGGLSFSTDDSSLREAFTRYGEVVDARVINDRESGRSRGFGFVTFCTSEEASAAIQALDGQELHGRTVRVNYANDRPRSFGGGGGGYGGGGYGGGGGGYGGGGYGGGGGGYGGGGYGGGSGGYGGGGYGGGNDGGFGGGGVSNFGNSYGSDSYGGGNNQSQGAGYYGGGKQGFGGGSVGAEQQSGGGKQGFGGGSVGAEQQSGGGDYEKGNDEDGFDHDDSMDNAEDGDDKPDDYANRRA